VCGARFARHTSSRSGASAAVRRRFRNARLQAGAVGTDAHALDSDGRRPISPGGRARRPDGGEGMPQQAWFLNVMRVMWKSRPSVASASCQFRTVRPSRARNRPRLRSTSRRAGDALRARRAPAVTPGLGARPRAAAWTSSPCGRHVAGRRKRGPVATHCEAPPSRASSSAARPRRQSSRSCRCCAER